MCLEQQRYKNICSPLPTLKEDATFRTFLMSLTISCLDAIYNGTNICALDQAMPTLWWGNKWASGAHLGKTYSPVNAFATSYIWLQEKQRSSCPFQLKTISRTCITTPKRAPNVWLISRSCGMNWILLHIRSASIPQRDGCCWGSPSGGCWSSGVWCRHSSRPSAMHLIGDSPVSLTEKKTYCRRYASGLYVSIWFFFFILPVFDTTNAILQSEKPWFTERNVSWLPRYAISWCFAMPSDVDWSRSISPH